VNIFDRYILRKFLGAFFAIMGMVMVLVFIVDFVEKMDMILEKKPPVHALIFQYYLNLLPFFGSMLAPICVFLAVIFFTSKLAQRTELVPVLTAGVSFYRIAAIYFVVALGLGALAFYVKGYLLPLSIDPRMAFEYQYFKPRRIGSNYNVHKKVAKDSYITIGYYDTKSMIGHRFTLEQTGGHDVVRKIYAEQAVWIDSTRHWRLERGQIREIAGDKERLIPFEVKDTTFLIGHSDIFIIELKQNSLTNPALTKYIELEEMRGSDILPKLYEERYRRYSDPLAIVILTLIGFAMSSRKSRGGIALQIGLGILLCFVYVVLLVAGVGMAGDSFPIWIAVWFPNVLFGFVSIGLLRWAPK